MKRGVAIGLVLGLLVGSWQTVRAQDLTTQLANFLVDLRNQTLGASNTTILSFTATNTALGTTSTDGLVLTNTTDAAAGAQQISPRIRLRGEGWKTNATAASQTVDWVIENLPVQGAAAPASTLLFKESLDGAAYTTYLTMGGAGVLLQPSTVFGWVGEARFTPNADGIVILTNAAENAGAALDVTTDGKLQVKSRALGVGLVQSGFIATGAAPSVANVGANSCGTSAATIAGNDNAGIVTVGATSGTQCRVTFTTTAPNRWQCVPTNETTANLLRSTAISTTQVDFLGTMVGGDVLSYICMPR